MAKRVDSFALNRCRKRVCIGEDRISQLPDEILVYYYLFLLLKKQLTQASSQASGEACGDIFISLILMLPYPWIK